MARFIQIVMVLVVLVVGLGFYIHHSTGYLHRTYDADLMKIVNWFSATILPDGRDLGGPILPRAGG